MFLSLHLIWPQLDDETPLQKERKHHKFISIPGYNNLFSFIGIFTSRVHRILVKSLEESPILLVVAPNEDTNTGVEDQKGTGAGGEDTHARTHTQTDTLFPKPAITCLSGYLPAQPGAHLTAR